LEERLGEPMEEGQLELSSLGFDYRHHVPLLSNEEHTEVEVQAGARFLQAAIHACGWEPGEIQGVLVGMSAPVVSDFLERITRLAGISERALKVAVHKACDSSVGALNLAMNPALALRQLGRNLADELRGKKILVGGIEGLSRFMQGTRDRNALQLFGNGAGIIGFIPGENMEFLVGETHEAYDDEGVLAVHMVYPHSGRPEDRGSYVDVSETGENSIRVAGLMHEPEDDSTVVMAGPMGMVKLFVRTGVQVVKDVYQAYQEKGFGLVSAVPGKERSIALAIVHHANYKINKLKEKNLVKEGIQLPMPWLLSDFGNVSAASNMIAFLRGLPGLKPGNHLLFDGFGAGTYYDVLAVELGK
jgi:3-oxoacyl-[acyl-carrier-protein] synthase III